MWNTLRTFFLNQRPQHFPNSALQRFKMMSSGSDYDVKFSTPAASNAVPKSASDKSHWVRDADNGEVTGFLNPWDSSRVLAFPALFKAMIQYALTWPGLLCISTVFNSLTWAFRHKFFSGDSQKPDTTSSTVPVVKPNFLPSRTGCQALRATWLGHACYFVEFPTGLRVLFDPVFEERCSPFSWIGHKRLTPKPCDISSIPIIDCVSHSFVLLLSLVANMCMMSRLS